MRPHSATRSVLAAVATSLAACHHQSNEPIEQAKRYFGPSQQVSPWGTPVPNGAVFIAVPDPAPADYDGYAAVLVPRSGQPLQKEAAVRFVWQSGVRDAELLSQVAALFLGGSRQIAHVADRGTTIIRGHERIEDPALSGERLVFFEVSGLMAPTAYEVTVDLGTFKASVRPAEAAAPAAAP